MVSADATSGVSAGSQGHGTDKGHLNDVPKAAQMYSTMKGGGLDLSKVIMNGCVRTGTCHIAEGPSCPHFFSVICRSESHSGQVPV